MNILTHAAFVTTLGIDRAICPFDTPLEGEGVTLIISKGLGKIENLIISKKNLSHFATKNFDETMVSNFKE